MKCAQQWIMIQRTSSVWLLLLCVHVHVVTPMVTGFQKVSSERDSFNGLSTLTSAIDHDYCNRPKECVDDDLYGDPENCQCYYLCLHLYLVPQCCGHGLEFNVHTGRCDWEGHGQCQEPCPPYTGPTTVSPQSEYDYCNRPEFCLDGTNYGDPEDCQCYYLCLYLDEIHVSCAPGLEFNVETGQCAFAGQGKCQQPCPLYTGPTTLPPESAPCQQHVEMCASDPDVIGMHFPDKHYCTQYYACTEYGLDGPWKCQSYPLQLVFDTETRSCEPYSADIDCEERCPQTTTQLLTTTEQAQESVALTTELYTTEFPTTLMRTISTQAPTTEAETTHVPTTEAETTQVPTTVAETTQVPTTEAETTQVPTTEAETTQVPTTEAETTEVSTTVTVAETTQVPTTEAETTRVPTTEAETTQVPTTEAETTEVPTTEADTTEVPTTEVETTEVPTTEAKTTEMPTTEADTTQVPTTEAETTPVPTTEAETTQVPTTEAETTLVPSTEAETTQVPTTEAETTQVPTTEAETTQIPTTEAGTTQMPSTETETKEVPTTEAETTEVPTTEAEKTEVPTTEAEPKQAPTTEVIITTLVPTTVYSIQTTELTTSTNEDNLAGEVDLYSMVMVVAVASIGSLLIVVIVLLCILIKRMRTGSPPSTGSDVAIMKDFGEDISQSSSSGISSSTLTSDLMPDEELDVELEKYYELLQQKRLDSGISPCPLVRPMYGVDCSSVDGASSSAASRRVSMVVNPLYLESLEQQPTHVQYPLNI